MINMICSFCVKLEILATYFMERTSQSHEKTLSEFVLPLIDGHHQDKRGYITYKVISAYINSLYKRLLIQNRTTFLHFDCLGMKGHYL